MVYARGELAGRSSTNLPCTGYLARIHECLHERGELVDETPTSSDLAVDSSWFLGDSDHQSRNQGAEHTTQECGGTGRSVAEVACHSHCRALSDSDQFQ